MGTRNSADKDKVEGKRPPTDPAAVRRIWVKLGLIALILGVWYVRTTYFAPPEVAPPAVTRNVEVETGPVVETPAAEPATKVADSSNPASKPTTLPAGSTPSNTTQPKPNQVNTTEYNPTQPKPTQPKTTQPNTTQPKPKGVYLEGKIAHNVVILNLDDEVVYRGSVDLTKSLERIRKGTKLSQFHNDGVVFQNRERRLPSKAAGYYHEWVHPTPQVNGPGPQRIVTGEAGDTWYTPDHYRKFYQVPK